ncbi:MAG: FRG domain-containing protein [Prevotella sp.]|nr:FRG domain-containing protein [Prevotella sp.]
MNKDYIFDDIDKAWDYILTEEEYQLENDSRRTNIKKHVPYDCLYFPDTAFFNDTSLDKFIMTRLKSGRYSLKPNLRNRKYLFRGQNAFLNLCRPNLFRNRDQTRFVIENVSYQELFLVMLSHPLVQLLDLGIDLNGQYLQFEMNLYGLTQHYYNKTAFIDLTSDMNVASFFAVTDYDVKTDTYRPHLSNGIGIIYCYPLCPSSFKFPIKGTKLTTIGLQVFPRSGLQRGFLVELDRDDNFNSFPGLEIIKFKHNEMLSRKYFKEFDGGKNLFPQDILQHNWGCHKRNVISENTLKFNHLVNPNENLESVRKEILDSGWKIEDYIPKFSEDELNTYYKDIENGFWGNFCDKIYIPGDKTGKMKEDLIHIPDKSRYSWAFKPGIPHTIDYSKGFLLKKYKDLLQRL